MNLISHKRFEGNTVTRYPGHGKGHKWYFSDVEFAGESETEIRNERFHVVGELEKET